MSPKQGKSVALTFDDGPNPPYTDQILDILKKEAIRATFFVCGANINRHPETLKLIVNNKHAIANHTYYHHYLPCFLGLTYQEILETQKIIDQMSPQKEKLFKAPWCQLRFWLKTRLEKSGFKIVLCGVLGNDWERGINAQTIAQKILSGVKNGSVITLHDGYNSKGADRSKTVAALPIIIQSLKTKGYEFTLP